MAGKIKNNLLKISALAIIRISVKLLEHFSWPDQTLLNKPTASCQNCQMNPCLGNYGQQLLCHQGIRSHSCFWSWKMRTLNSLCIKESRGKMLWEASWKKGSSPFQMSNTVFLRRPASPLLATIVHYIRLHVPCLST